MTDPHKELRRAVRGSAARQRKYFRARAKAHRRWRDQRDGPAGPAGPCKRLDPVTGELIKIVAPTNA